MSVFPSVRMDISIHAPRTGSDSRAASRRQSRQQFQSTLPARGATVFPDARTLGRRISIHAPRTGSDPAEGTNEAAEGAFQSTLPARGATRCERVSEQTAVISIHAPRTGSDRMRHATPRRAAISIHAPRTGSDPGKAENGHKKGDFNPRSPHGERQRKVTILSIRIIGFAQKVYHKTVLLRISLAENAVILPKRPQNPVRTSLQKAGGLRFARAIRAARPYSISSPSGA